MKTEASPPLPTERGKRGSGVFNRIHERIKVFTKSEIDQQSARCCLLTAAAKRCQDPMERKVLEAKFQKEYAKFASMERRQA